MGSTGAVVELSGSGDVEYVSYVWRSSSSFDEYENRFETISGVSEVVVRGVSADGARVLSSSVAVLWLPWTCRLHELGARVELDCGARLVLSGRSACSLWHDGCVWHSSGC